MNTIIKSATAACGALALSGAYAQAGSYGGIKDPLGVSVPQAQADRTIPIDATTRWVNVKRMETVRFVVGQGSAAKTFTWRFDGLPNQPFGLDQIAPAGTLGGQAVTVYVARNRQIDGGR